MTDKKTINLERRIEKNLERLQNTYPKDTDSYFLLRDGLMQLAVEYKDHTGRDYQVGRKREWNKINKMSRASLSF